MRIGYVGLGRIGLRMVLRILKAHQFVAHDIDPDAVAEAEKLGAEPIYTLEKMAGMLVKPRTIRIMAPTSKPVDAVVGGLEPHLEPGDTLIDGGNSFYGDSIRRAERLNEKGIHYLDVGTSGGLEGAEQGASLTVGGDEKVFLCSVPLFESIARPEGYLHCGPSGAGHYVKMVARALSWFCEAHFHRSPSSGKMRSP